MSRPASRGPAIDGLRTRSIAGGDLGLVLNNTLAAIEAGRLEILRHLAPLALDALVINRVEVVFEEVISNIVRHGFKPGAEQTILVHVAARPQAIAFVFEDDGAPFDPTTAPEPAPLTTLESAPLGGLGIPMVRRLAASVAYEVVPPGEAGPEFGARTCGARNRLRVSVTTTR
jgi:anti-sigma regulatory factor (Ser/Thr protein kinase)